MKIRLLLLAIPLLITIGCAAVAVSPSVAAPTASPMPFPTPTASPSASSPSFGTPGAQPPNALLSVGGGAATRGQLGTFTWLGTGSDAPWLPGSPINVAAGGAATISFDPALGVAAWSIRKAKPGARDEIGAREIAAGNGAITFSVPAEAGTLALHVEFPNAGDANYFWALSPG